jgi:hypothetical protein
MACILVADYGREDLLALGSPVGSLLRAWGHKVIEVQERGEILQQMQVTRFDAVLLYDTLLDLESLRTHLHQQGATQGVPILILHETVQHMQFTDMVVVASQYRLNKSRRQFDVDELRQLLQAAGLP